MTSEVSTTFLAWATDVPLTAARRSGLAALAASAATP